MRRCFLSFLVGVVLCAAPAFAHDDALTFVARYAAVLEAFDARLDGPRALRLALRTVAESSACGIDARLVVALVAVESRWDPAARSRAGARGLGQLMPATAADLGVDPADPDANLDGTIRYLATLLARYGRLPPQARFEHVIAAYNAGPGAVDRYGGIPPYPETRQYVNRVIELWRRLAVAPRPEGRDGARGYGGG